MLIPILTAIHVIGVVIWIGGVAFVTLVIFPMLAKTESSLEQVLLFQRVEHRFAKIAKICIAVVGLSGLWLLHLRSEWGLLFTLNGIGPTVMLTVWIFYVMVLLLESRLFKIIFGKREQKDTKKIFYKLTLFHWIILILSLTAVGIGTWAGHGGI
ncbi:MAG: hypothetical protein D6828_02085, partial [Nitrospirae bacterium]